MKTKIELEQNILALTSTIQKQFPELSKYIMEIPVHNSDEDSVGLKNLDEYYESLAAILHHYAATHHASSPIKTSEFPGYPSYPPSEDMYNQGKKEPDLNPEDLSKRKAPNEITGTKNEKDFASDRSGDDLDVPGSELDNQQESVGSEDEENNYYSLGGDAHNDLEEN